MAMLPEILYFAQNDSSIANLNALAYAVQFLVDDDVRPVWHFYKDSASQSLTASIFATVTYNHNPIDSDGVYAATHNGVATIQTQGYYAVEACVPFAPGTFGSMAGLNVNFLFTAGSGNPHYPAGVTIQFGIRGSSPVTDATGDTVVCITDIVPVCCYPGDTIAVQAFSGLFNATINTNLNGSWESQRIVPNFTGYWVALGT